MERSGSTSVLRGTAGTSAPLELACPVCTEAELVAEARALGAVLAASSKGSGPCEVETEGVPNDAVILIDDIPGRAPGRAQTLEPGEHVLSAAGKGYRRVVSFSLSPGETRRLAWSEMGEERPRARPIRVIFAIGGTGFAAAAAGTALLLLDGDCATTEVDAHGRCETVHSLKPLGWSFVGAGAAAVVAAAVYGVVAARRAKTKKRVHTVTP